MKQNSPVKLPSIPRNLTVTQKKLARIFMEDIPKNICDSGMVYGYRYQANREYPVWKEPESWCWFHRLCRGDLDIDLRLNLFKLLSDQLEYDKDADKVFQKWRKKWFKEGSFDEEYDGWEGHLEDDFPELSAMDSKPEKWITGYTYNDETLLSQNFTYWYSPDTSIVIISLHNGCDARSGFTEPVLFRLNYSDDFYPWKGASIWCPDCGTCWGYDNAMRFEYTNAEERGVKDLYKYPCENGEEGRVGTVVVTKEGKAYCPVCGKGILG